MMDNIEKLVDAAEELGWSVHLYTQKNADGKVENYAEISQQSPAGENFRFEVFYEGADSLVRQVCEAYEDFDPDNHVEELIVAKANGLAGVPRASVLVRDADKIDKMLDELSDKLIDVLANMREEGFVNDKGRT